MGHLKVGRRVVLERLRHLGRDLAGRGHEVLVGHLEEQLDVTIDAVRTVRAVAAAELTTAEGHERLRASAELGETARTELVRELSRTLASPIDREDLFRLSRSVDDVLDNLHDLSREFDLFEVPGEPLLVEVLEDVEAGCVALLGAVRCLVDAPERAADGATEVKRNDVRPGYERAIATLFADGQEVTPELLRRRELLRRVDVVGLRLAEAADVLADGAIKRSH
jgi:uncharacterized protein